MIFSHNMEDILVDIVSHLPEHANTTFGVATAERNTVAGLIRKLCKENRIPLKTSYTLRDGKQNLLQWSQTLQQCGIRHGDTLFLCNEVDDVRVRGGCSWNSWWFLAGMCLIIGGVGITAVSILLTKNGAVQYQYGIVLDAGSSHTKMFIYRWDGEKLDSTARAHQVHTCTVKGGGLTSYSQYPANLSAPLMVCLDEAKRVVPAEKHSSSPVFLGATAGMRMLNEVNEQISDDILLIVRQTIQSYPFQFLSPRDQVRIISGEEEGTFGWVTANYASGRLGVHPDLTEYSEEEVKEPTQTVGALDMGGASTQITFYTPKVSEIPPSYKEDLTLYGHNFSVYTHSYLCYGINEAIRRYKAILVQAQGYNETNITNPCGPTGNISVDTYTDVFEAPCATRFAGEFIHLQPSDFVDKTTNYTFYGTSDESACQATVQKLFNFSAPCPTQPCTFNGTYQPQVFGQFYAFSSFFYEMDFLNLTKKDTTLKQFEDSLSTLCNLTWDVVSHMKAGDNGSMLGWYCFEGHYIHTLLVDAYKFNADTWSNIQFIQKINHTDIGWTLGYMLNSSNIIPGEGPKNYISTAAFSALTVLFSIFILLSIVFGCFARRQRSGRVTGLYESVPTYGAV